MLGMLVAGRVLGLMLSSPTLWPIMRCARSVNSIQGAEMSWLEDALEYALAMIFIAVFGPLVWAYAWCAVLGEEAYKLLQKTLARYI